MRSSWKAQPSRTARDIGSSVCYGESKEGTLGIRIGLWATLAHQVGEKEQPPAAGGHAGGFFEQGGVQLAR